SRHAGGLSVARQSRITLTGTWVPAITAWSCITLESAGDHLQLVSGHDSSAPCPKEECDAMAGRRAGLQTDTRSGGRTRPHPLARLTKTRGAKWGANGARHKATQGDVQRRSGQLAGSSADAKATPRDGTT